MGIILVEFILFGRLPVHPVGSAQRVGAAPKERSFQGLPTVKAVAHEIIIPGQRLANS